MSESRVGRWIAALPEAERRALALRFRALVDADEGHYIVDPAKAPGAALAPLVFDDASRARFVAGADVILRSVSLLARDIMADESGAGPRRRDQLLGPMAAMAGEKNWPIVSRLIASTWRATDRMATTRVDFLLDADGRAWALELNPTVPVGHGFWDIAGAALLRACGERLGLDDAAIARLIASNGSHADDLLASLLEHDAADGHPPGPKRIAIVARENDPELGELRYLARRFTARGHHALVVTPPQLTRVARGATVDGEPVDLIYSHVMFSFVDPQGEYAAMMHEPRRYRLWNPMASFMAPKACLALLSEIVAPGAEAEADRLGLGPLVDGLRACLPWTRIVAAKPGTDPEGKPVDDVAALVAAHPERFVVKHSMGFGGQSVFIGGDLGDASAQARLRKHVGAARDLAWHDLVAHAVTHPGAWVAQQKIPTAPRKMLVLDGAGALGDTALFHDVAAFASLGNETARPRGLISRASTSRLTNLANGGFVVPVLSARVDEALIPPR